MSASESTSVSMDTENCECPKRLFCTKCERFEDDIYHCEGVDHSSNWTFVTRCQCAKNKTETVPVPLCECPKRLFCTKCGRFEDDLCYCEGGDHNTHWILMKRCQCAKNNSD